MSDSINDLIRELRVQGPRQFAAWNEEAFNCYVTGAVAQLAKCLHRADKDTSDQATTENFLRMVFEGAMWG